MQNTDEGRTEWKWFSTFLYFNKKITSEIFYTSSVSEVREKYKTFGKSELKILAVDYILIICNY